MQREGEWEIGWCTREKRRARPTRVAHFIYCACCNSAGARPQIESCLCPELLLRIRYRANGIFLQRGAFLRKVGSSHEPRGARNKRAKGKNYFRTIDGKPTSSLTTTRACAIRDNGETRSAGLQRPFALRIMVIQ